MPLSSASVIQADYSVFFSQIDDIDDLKRAGWSFSAQRGKGSFAGTDSFLVDDEMLVIRGVDLGHYLAMTPELWLESGRTYQVSVGLETLDVVIKKKAWHGARAGVLFYDSDNRVVGERSIKILKQVGSNSYRNYEAYLEMPRDAEYLKLWIELKEAAGTIKVGELRIRQIKASLAASVLESCNVKSIGVRKTIDLDFDKRGFEKLAVEMSSRLVEEALSESSIYELNQFGRPFFQLRLSDGGEAELNEIPPEKVNDGQWFFFSGSIKEGKPTYEITAAGRQGFYYALQKIRCLARNENENQFTPRQVIDWPNYALRGLVVGDFNRWNNGFFDLLDTSEKPQRKPFKQQAEDQLYNAIWITRWPKHYSFITERIPNAVINELADFVMNCNTMLIEPFLGVRPYRQLPTPKNPKGGVRYSSQNDARSVAENLVRIADLGVKNIYLAFDDESIVGELSYTEDREKFSSLGEAHLHFILSVYEYIKESRSGVNLIVVPASYSGHNFDSSVKAAYNYWLSQLPTEIKFVWSGNGTADYEGFVDDVGRKVLVWSNFYPKMYRHSLTPPSSAPSFLDGKDFLGVIDAMLVLPFDLAGENRVLDTWEEFYEYLW